MAPPDLKAAPGPGAGPEGVPAAIALSPILSSRYRPGDLERIRAAAPGSVIVNISPEGLADGALDEVEVLMRGRLPREVFDRLLARTPSLRWVHSATAGVERVLTPATIARGLTITNARGVFSRPIAEYVVAMILAVSRRLPGILELQRERTWQPLEGVEMRDLTIGIVGLGSIGRTVARLAGSFGARVVATRRRPGQAHGPEWSAEDVPAGGTSAEEASVGEGGGSEGIAGGRLEVLGGPEALPRLLETSDFVVLAVPLTPETEGIIDAEALAAMHRGAYLINIARGRLVDERALERALREGRLGGAVLDTFREEPLPPDSPLWNVPNLIVTPHTSWSTGGALDRSVALFAANLERYRRGEPLLNVVDPALGY
jgi:phosphoglycerate dehydrogenase-like enzyme